MTFPGELVGPPQSLPAGLQGGKVGGRVRLGEQGSVHQAGDAVARDVALLLEPRSSPAGQGLAPANTRLVSMASVTPGHTWRFDLPGFHPAALHPLTAEPAVSGCAVQVHRSAPALTRFARAQVIMRFPHDGPQDPWLPPGYEVLHSRSPLPGGPHDWRAFALMSVDRDARVERVMDGEREGAEVAVDPHLLLRAGWHLTELRVLVGGASRLEVQRVVPLATPVTLRATH